MTESVNGRRSVLRNGAQLLTGICIPSLGLATLGGSIAGCSTGPKAPPPPTAPLQNVGVLTVGQSFSASGDAAPFFGVSTAQMTLNPIAQIVAAFRVPFVNAVASVRFNAQDAIHKRLVPALLAAGLPVVALEDYQLAADVRNWIFKGAPAEVDAFLDVQVTSAGYYPASGAGGYSPMMYVVATLISPAKSGEQIARFNYDADHRPAEGDSRFFTTPKVISADKPETIIQKAELIRAEMDNIAARMVDRMVIDIGRRIRNETRLT
jgi:hypothetical protein